MFSGVSFGSLLLIFFLALVLFGTEKVKTIGRDLGTAIREFRESLDGNDSDKKQ